MNQIELKHFLETYVGLYNQPDFIEADPISIPHQFDLQQDKEIAGFFSAIFAWGKRSIILRKANELMRRMDFAPYQFIVHHQESDLRAILGFKHRTFNDTDLLYFIHFLNYHYQQHSSLESAFTRGQQVETFSMEKSLNEFKHYVFSLENAPKRTQKHISSPLQKASCKRLVMYLRWMVRRDKKGVDFGLWNQIPMSQLICPCDVHVLRVAYALGLVKTPKSNWKIANELTQNLKHFDPDDPAKYDFALFGLGVLGKY
jgi:uncharacterized protein (TIGR02757 family)